MSCLKKRFLSASIAAFVLSLSFSAISEDIEIYTSAIGADVEGVVNANVLFIIDSSGSMDDATAAVRRTEDYDPDTDYGDNDDYVYVYDDLGSYTGEYFTADQNKCDAATDKFASTPELPVYLDRGMQWKSFQYCPEGADSGGGETPLNGSGSVNDSTENYFDEVNVSDLVDGTSMNIEVTNEHSSRWILFELQEYAGSWDAVSGCTFVAVPGNSTGDCSVDVSDLDSGATKIRVRVYVYFNSTYRDWYGTHTYNIGAEGGAGTCDEADKLTGTEWLSDLETSADTSSILECQGDGGLHNDTGDYDAVTNTDVYLAYCPEDSCDEPYYSSLSGNEIDWPNEDIDYHQFVPGNYHNYLQSAGSDIDALYMADSGGTKVSGTQNPDTYCGSRDREDEYFIGTDGYVYECQYYIEIARDAAVDVATQQTGINVGAMRFDGVDEQGGYVINAIEDVSTNLATFSTAVQGIPAGGGTPLGETYYEAYLYFSGQDPYYGVDGGADSGAFIDGDTSKDYESPITNACQSNNIIYLSDGQPNSDSESDNRIESISGISNCGSGGGTTPDTSCLDELAEYMANEDLNTNIDGNNTVNSFFVGFNQTLSIFEEAARKGNGQYFEASSYDDLLDSFEQIFVNIAVDTPTTLVAPAVSVNAFNELQHRDQIYYAIFEPSLSPRWQGNVKKFTIDGTATVMDQNGDAAVDSDTGFFLDSSQSYWSDAEDGGEVDKGGFTEQSTNSRNIYVDGATVSSEIDIVQLTGASAIVPASLGVSTSDEAGHIRDWFLGIDVEDQDNDGMSTDAHNYAGDPLHSKPFVITYSGTSVGDSDDVLFVTTNLGMLHAVDANNGEELWAYIPEDLMVNAEVYLDDDASEGHTYGLDGEATVWTIEDTSANDFALESAYMYQGMRRGGSSYYAWDISNALSEDKIPISEMWTLPGTNTTDFTDLGQTWSKMIQTKMTWGCGTESGCETRDVLVFSGGYDEYYDTKENMPKTASSDIKGNAIYIVDALGGWDSSGDNDGFVYKIGDGGSYDLSLPMYNSIPADPSPIDSDGDGDMDILFFVDIAGHVWRVDFDQDLAKSTEGYTTGGMTADLYDGTNFRRFYNALDVSLSAPDGGSSYYNLAVGSGYRAYPKEDESWTNALYVLYDENVTGPALDNGNSIYTYYEDEVDNSLSVVDLDDLHVWAEDDLANRDVNAQYGFYRELDGSLDEKMLQSSITFADYILFSSYVPVGSGSDATCGSGEIGSGRTYLLDLATGAGALEYDTDGDGDIDAGDNDTYLDLAHEGIPPDPTILLVPELVVCIGTECSDDLLDFPIGWADRTFWREN